MNNQGGKLVSGRLIVPVSVFTFKTKYKGKAYPKTYKNTVSLLSTLVLPGCLRDGKQSACVRRGGKTGVPGRPVPMSYYNTAHYGVKC